MYLRVHRQEASPGGQRGGALKEWDERAGKRRGKPLYEHDHRGCPRTAEQREAKGAKCEEDGREDLPKKA